MMQKALNFMLLTACMASPAWAIETELYGSVRMGFETVNPDGEYKDYTGMRDAASRIGGKISETIAEGWSITAQMELPFDSVKLAKATTNRRNSHVRIANVQLASPYGTLEYGRGWLPYYNNIAAPLDQMNSYYSGWASFANFRKKETLHYVTPRIHGFQLAFATSGDNGDLPERHKQYTASYANEGLTIAVGHDDRGEGSYANNGVAISYTTDPWHFAAKYEEMDSDDEYDGQTFQNLLVQYTLDDKNTFRAIVSEAEAWDFGKTVYHAGWSHQYDDALRLFVEYYEEESPAAVSGVEEESGPAAGGQVLTTGFRYDL